MFFGINQICLTDLLNSQINDIYSSQPSEKGWQRHVSRAPRDEKHKRNLRGEEKKKRLQKIPYTWIYEICENSKKSFVETCMHKNRSLHVHVNLFGCTDILQLNTQHTC